MIRTTQASVTTTRGVLFTPGPEASIWDPVPLLVTNRDAGTSVYLGGPDLTAGNGYELKAQESVGMQLTLGDALYALSASGIVRVDVLKGRQL